MLDKFFNLFSQDMGIDLGTASTLVYVPGKGIIINEPSVVAVNQKTGQIVAIGNDAKNMAGRTPAHISVIRPLVEGVISDFETTEEMLAYFIRKVNRNKFLSRPAVVIGIPTNVTEVETRAVRDAAKNAGSRKVYIVEQPMAAAIGVKCPIHEPIGNIIVDIGGGTSDIAVISLKGIVVSKSLRIAGDRLDQDIIQYVRDEFKLLIGGKTAEDVKMAIGSAMTIKGQDMEATIRGRDLITGLPREVAVTDGDIREAISKSLRSLANAVKEVIEETPPELISDIMHRGIILVGGGSLLKGLSEYLEKETKISVYVAEDPLTVVARGMGIILENLEDFREVLIEHEDDIPPQY
ncbi:MAG: rod shape-determining protein [bacterium]|nr:rod shape-determining protein [bacterium]